MPEQKVAQTQDTTTNDADAVSELAGMLADPDDTADADDDLEDDVADSSEPDAEGGEKPKTPEPKAEEPLTDAQVNEYLSAAVAPEKKVDKDKADKTPAAKPRRSEAVRAKLDTLKGKIGELDGDAIFEALGEITKAIDEADEPANPQTGKPSEAQMKVLRLQLHATIEGALPGTYGTEQAKDQLIEVAELIALGAIRKGAPISDNAAFMAAHAMLQRAKGDGQKAAKAHGATRPPTPGGHKRPATPAKAEQKPQSVDQEAIGELRRLMRAPAKKQ